MHGPSLLFSKWSRVLFKVDVFVFFVGKKENRMLSPPGQVLDLLEYPDLHFDQLNGACFGDRIFFQTAIGPFNGNVVNRLIIGKAKMYPAVYRNKTLFLAGTIF